jgi:hypothetical protein
MLMSFLSYQNKKFLRSYHYIAPSLCYFIWLMINYMYRNLPILPSYAISMIVLMPIMTWITIVCFNKDSINERYLFQIHLSSKIKYILFKSIYLLLFSLIFIIIAIILPIILGSFIHKITVTIIVISFLVHIWAAVFGILIGLIVQNWFLMGKKYAWLITIFILLITMLKTTLIEKIPTLKWVLWIFPPFNSFMTQLKNDTLNLFEPHFILLNIYCCVYTLIVTLIIVIIYRKNG